MIDEINTPIGVIQAVEFDLSSLESTKTAATEIIASTDRLDLLFLKARCFRARARLDQGGIRMAYWRQLPRPRPVHPTPAACSSQDSCCAKQRCARHYHILRGRKGIRTQDRPSTRPVQDRHGLDRWYGTLRPVEAGQTIVVEQARTRVRINEYAPIAFIAVHPGLVKTENFSNADGAGWFAYLWRLLLATTGVTAEEGTKTQLWAATSKDAKTGKFYFPIGKEDDGGKYGHDQDKMEELWYWTTVELATHGGKGWPSV